MGWKTRQGDTNPGGRMGNVVELTQIADLLEARARNGGRVIAAIAGAPGFGKSTLAEKLAGKLKGRQE